ncbi:MAG: HEAT repeat domain-containing protein [Pirellulales bacterium]|nr:HEAT repeat domain-containing protein [Pirellulales bacterium]
MSETTPLPSSLLPDDALPPVEPPSAGFLVQLFVIPGVIVAIIVAVWLLFHWLANMGNDPEQYIKKLRGNSDMRWQAASNLAGSLHGEAGDQIKANPKQAAELAAILDEEITAGRMDEKPVNMRIFLCRALGEFRVPEALPILIKAASTQRDEKEIDVRRAAVQGLAVIASNLADPSLSKKYPTLVPTIVDASRSDNDQLRTEAAFALGQLDDAAAAERLKAMLDDPHVDARFNAAGFLARRGDGVVLPVLLEMLDPDQALATRDEKKEAQNGKRILVNINGLRNLVELKRANPSLDITDAMKAVEVLTHSELPEVRDHALDAQRKLKASTAKSPST